MRYVVVGNGKMGSAVDAHARGRGHERVAVIDTRRDAWAADLGDATVAFEFTAPEAAAGNVRALVGRGLAVVTGTTGWEPDAALRDRAHAAGVGVVHAANFSVGVHAFFRVAAAAARILGAVPGYDPAVVELHHRGKRDVPSGTARRLATIVAEGFGAAAGDPVLGHASQPIERGAVHVVGVRAGAEPGTHTVLFDGAEDRIELCHRARGRDGFAAGAVLAAEWIEGRTGWYGFEDTLDDVLARDGRR
jgi:4-hydroxy-tetrahydrodipicolinate reductase